MLFSNQTIAKKINDAFEPAWHSLREVPKVTIDFGNGRIIRRTLHGNIATFVCDPLGHVLDVLPGIYDPETYVKQLDELDGLFRYLRSQRTELLYYRALTRYHNSRSTALELAARGVSLNQQHRTARVAQTGQKDRSALENWPALRTDTEINEGERRLKIHKHLKNRVIRPEAMTTWLYREVLNADLEDPYLGLGKKLFATYPFER